MILLGGWSGSGDMEATPEFSTGTAFSFGNPFGVVFKKGVEFFSSGNVTPSDRRSLKRKMCLMRKAFYGIL